MTGEQAIRRLHIADYRHWPAKKILKYSVATIEHLVRRVDGGTRPDGIVMACMFCNSGRHGASVEEHRAAMAWKVMRGDHPVNRDAQMSLRSPPSAAVEISTETVSTA